MELSEDLKRTLESDCGHTLDAILVDKSPEIFAQLRSVLTTRKKIAKTVRQNAISLLGRWGDPDVVADIVKLLPKFDARERMNAIDALGHLGTPAAFEAIAEQADDADPDIRRFAVYALDRIGSNEAVAKLREIAAKEGTGFVRTKAAHALRRREQQAPRE